VFFQWSHAHGVLYGTHKTKTLCLMDTGIRLGHQRHTLGRTEKETGWKLPFLCSLSDLLSCFQLGTLFLYIVLPSKIFLNPHAIHSLACITPCDVLICQFTLFITKMTRNAFGIAGFGKKKIITWTQLKTIQNVS